MIAFVSLAGIALVAATVTGAFGYGFSSITVPVALLFFPNRVLNPALVLLEVGINLYVLAVNRSAFTRVWRRVLPIIAGCLPGVAAGSVLLNRLDPDWVKLVTFASLLPVILLQVAGMRRPIRAESLAGVALGAPVGVLYAISTVSGPPLALALNNQGFVKDEFRAALGTIRLALASFTAVAYYRLGIYSAASLPVVICVVPAVLVGIRAGTMLVRRVPAETFRRLCMSFDSGVVGYGLCWMLRALHVTPPAVAYAIWMAAVLVDGGFLVAYFSQRAARPKEVFYDAPFVRRPA